jgi:hypothetical protein
MTWRKVGIYRPISPALSEDFLQERQAVTKRSRKAIRSPGQVLSNLEGGNNDIDLRRARST